MISYWIWLLPLILMPLKLRTIFPRKIDGDEFNNNFQKKAVSKITGQLFQEEGTATVWFHDSVLQITRNWPFNPPYLHQPWCQYEVVPPTYCIYYCICFPGSIFQASTKLHVLKQKPHQTLLNLPLLKLNLVIGISTLQKRLRISTWSMSFIIWYAPTNLHLPMWRENSPTMSNFSANCQRML